MPPTRLKTAFPQQEHPPRRGLSIMLWAPRLLIPACLRCGTIAQPHRTHGLCNRCWHWCQKHKYPTFREVRQAKASSLTLTEAAYVAGIIDGEGCIHLAKSERRKWDGVFQTGRMFIVVSLTYQPLITWLGNTIGGYVRQVKQKNPKHKTVWLWRLSGHNAASLLSTLLPYLRIKQEQALIAIEYDATSTKNREKREQLKLRMSVLNYRGVPYLLMENKQTLFRQMEQRFLLLTAGEEKP